MSDNYIDSLITLRNSLLTVKNILTNEEIDETGFSSHLETFIKTVDFKIKETCKHEYVEDYVDIDPERSQRITYCNKCMSCFPTE